MMNNMMMRRRVEVKVVSIMLLRREMGIFALISWMVYDPFAAVGSPAGAGVDGGAPCVFCAG